MTATIQSIAITNHTTSVRIKVTKYTLLFTSRCCLDWRFPVVTWHQLWSHFTTVL